MINIPDIPDVPYIADIPDISPTLIGATLKKNKSQ